MWYMSFHGGKSGNNNIYVYHDSGKPHSSITLLPAGKNDPPLMELRGFGFYANNYDNLYVLNGSKQYNQVLLYQLSKGKYIFDKIFASGPDINSIFHPYDLCFDTNGNIYISSQDTNVVTRLDPNAVPGSLPPALTSYGDSFLSGTFVASEIGKLPAITQAPYPPNVPKPLGLTVSYSDDTDKKVQNSVRGVLFYDGYLFVCDEPDSKVKIYDGTTGSVYGEISGDNLDKPVQLLLGPGNQHIYIASSGNGNVVRVDISNGVPSGTVVPETFTDNIKHISGIAFDASGNLYTAERKNKRILKFPPDGSGKGTDFITGLTDDPEFIMYVPKGD